ncbi:MAG: hypothetical protein ACM3TN_22910 [Alphaproteobacteria bacterium]
MKSSCPVIMLRVTRMIQVVRDDMILFASAKVNVARTICPHPSRAAEQEQQAK